MKNLIKVLLAVCLMILGGQIFAQDINGVGDNMSQKGNHMDVSSAISEVAKGINPDAFKRRFDISEWNTKLSGLETSNISGLKGNLNSLVGGLKGSSFEKGAKSEIFKKLVGINGKADISEMLESLVKGLKPKALTTEFSRKKDDFLAALKLVK